MNLFSIESSFAVLDAMLEESQGVLTPEIEAYMDTIGAMSLAKLFDLQNLRDQCQAFAKTCKEKADEFAAKAKALDARDARYRGWQVKIMSAAGQKSMTNGAHKITLVQNPLRIEVVDETAIPSTYQVAEVKMSLADYEKIKDQIEVKSVKPAADKKAIADLYKATGVELSGVQYVREDNVRVS